MMDTGILCAYNLTRGVFLSSKVTIADPAMQPLKLLKVLVGGLGLDSVSGLWLSPLSGMPTVPRLFPFDILYLDKNYRLIEAAELLPTVQFPQCGRNIASALILPFQTLTSTRTERGDRLIICSEEEIERQLVGVDTSLVSPPSQPVFGSKPSGRPGSWPKEANPNSSTGLAYSATPSSAVIGLAEEPTDLVAVSEHSGSVELARAAAETAESIAGAGTTASVAPGSTATEPKLIAAPLSDAEPDQPQLNAPDTSVLVHEPARSSRNDAAPEEIVKTTPVVASTSAQLNGATGPATQATPVMSITEVVVETPEHTLPLSVIEQEESTEELFSNWVEAPSLSSAWADHETAHPKTPPEKSRIQESGAATETAKQHAEISLPTNVAGDTLAVDRTNPTRSDASSRLKSDEAKVETPAVNPSPPSVPTRTALPPAPHSTTFTVANFGMWRVSMPTAALPIVAKKPSQESTPAAGADKPVKAVKPSAADVQRNELLESAIGEGAVPSPPAGPPATPTIAQPVAATRREHNSIEKQKPNLIAASETQNIEGERPQTIANSANPSIVDHPSEKVAQETAPPVPQSLKAEQKDRPKAASRPAESSTKTQGRPASLGERLKRWLNPAPVSSDRRRAYRRYVPGMIAHYYTGGAPKPHEVADISMSGFYLLTQDQWMPETMIQMTLQKPCANGERKQSITVLSRIVRRGSDGVAAEFVMPETLDPHSHDVQPSQTTDKFALARFL